MWLITVLDIFGEPMPPREGEILGCKTRGYNLKSGGWCLYPPENEEEFTSAEFVVIRWKGKHLRSIVDKRRIVEVEEIPAAMKARIKGESNANLEANYNSPKG